MAKSTAINEYRRLFNFFFAYRAVALVIALILILDGRAPNVIFGLGLWICQEALNNARKHSGLSQAGVSLTSDRDSLILTVNDAGTGGLFYWFENFSSSADRSPKAKNRSQAASASMWPIL
jgi:hypothetical protein